MNDHTFSSAIHSTGRRASGRATQAGMLSLALTGLLLLGGCNKGPAPAAPAAEPAPSAQAAAPAPAFIRFLYAFSRCRLEFLCNA